MTFDHVPPTPQHMVAELYSELAIALQPSPIIYATLAAARRGWDVLTAKWDARTDQWKFVLTCASGERVTVRLGIANSNAVIEALPKR